MSRGFPSMTALLGLLAVAGYQNKDKIAEWLGGLGQQSAPGASGRSQSGTQSGGLAGVLEQLGGGLSGATPGGILSGGLAELVERFKQSGHGDTAESWVRTGPNHPVTPSQLQQAIGPDVLDTLSRQTGLLDRGDGLVWSRSYPGFGGFAVAILFESIDKLRKPATEDPTGCATGEITAELL
jgi:uncharacterized protein YidB (DUF937 family)